MKLRIDPATEAEIRFVADHMRDADLAEFLAVGFCQNRQDVADRLVGVASELLVGALDEPICIGGVISTRPNTATLLFCATPRFAEIGYGMTRWIKKSLFSRLDAAGIHRIEAVSHGDYVWAHRWLEALGFEREAVLRQYGGDRSDYLVFARLK